MRLTFALICWLLAGTAIAWPRQDTAQNPQEERLGLFIQPGQQRQLRQLISGLADYAQARNIAFELIEVATTLPAELTATPAVVYQNQGGRAIYPGKHLDLAATQLFVDGNRLQIRPSVVDERTDVLYLQQGRATTILSLKLTPWAGDEGVEFPSLELLGTQLQEELQQSSDFQAIGSVHLQPTDRRYYLDVHPYRAVDGRNFLTYAVFSQFNCHEPIFTNFGEPVTSLEALATQIQAQLAPYLQEPQRGFSPLPLPELVVEDWAAFGWALPEQSEVALTDTAADLVVLPRSLTTIRPLGFGLPQVQFNFPAPLDRYAGTVDGLQGELQWQQDQLQLSGAFQVDMRSLTMGSDALDDYVKKDALRTRRFRQAQVKFGPVNLDEVWRLGQAKALEIPALLELMGLKVPMRLMADITAEYDAAGQLQLRISTYSEINIDQPFELVGPDGPADLKNKVELRTRFLLTP
ncbi:MAG: YceI family protein [Bacteroidota bacterium]